MGSVSGGNNPVDVELQVQDLIRGSRGHPPPVVGVVQVGASGDDARILRGGERSLRTWNPDMRSTPFTSSTCVLPSYSSYHYCYYLPPPVPVPARTMTRWT